MVYRVGLLSLRKVKMRILHANKQELVAFIRSVIEGNKMILVIDNSEEANLLKEALETVKNLPMADKPHVPSLEKAIDEIQNRFNSPKVNASVLNNDSNCVGDVCEA